MKLRILSLLPWLAATAVAQLTNPIQSLVLNPRTVTQIPVATDRLTTIRFPSPVSDLESALIGTEPHPHALFLLSVQPGGASFSLRALVPNTNTTLNVTWKGQTYVLDLVESRTPWLSVVFEPPVETTALTAARPVAPSRLLGLLDTAKAYGLLRQQHPSAVAGVEVVRPQSLRDYGDYTIRIEEVFRFEAEDTLVFRIGVSNKTRAPLPILPQSLMVRVGQRVYYQSITDATSTLPPATLVPIYFAITGSADGSRNAVSPKNDFMVLLARLENPAPTGPAASIPVPPPVIHPAPAVILWPVVPTAPPPVVVPVMPTPARPYLPTRRVPFSSLPDSAPAITPRVATARRYGSSARSYSSSLRDRCSERTSIGGGLFGFSINLSIGSDD